MAHITIEDIEPRRAYTVGSTPSTGPFTFLFAVFSIADIQVYIDGVLAEYTVDYTIALNSGADKGYPGGTVTLTSAVANVEVIIDRSTEIARKDDFPTSGPFNIPVLNTALDRQIVISQELRRDINNLIAADPDVALAVLGPRQRLTADLTLYVRPDGSALNSGRSNTAGGAMTPAAAISYVRDHVERDGHSVFIQFADGTYSLTSLTVNIPGGEGVFLYGNRSNPAACILEFPVSTVAALYGPQASILGGLDGFTIQLPTTVGRAAGGAGVLCDHGANWRVGPKLKIKKFYYPLAARYGAQIDASGTSSANRVEVEDAGDVGIWAFVGARITCPYALSTGANDSANGLGSGFAAEYGGSIEAQYAETSGCYFGGFVAFSGSSIRAYDSYSHDHPKGYAVGTGGSITAHRAHSHNTTFHKHYNYQGGTIFGDSMTFTGTGSEFNVDMPQVYDTGALTLNRTLDLNLIDGAGTTRWAMDNQSGGSSAQIALRATSSLTDVAAFIGGKGLGRTSLGDTTKNRLAVEVTSAGGGIGKLTAEGPDTHIDLFLNPKGSGSVRFGAFTSTTGTAASGYIPVRDASGTIRNLAVVDTDGSIVSSLFQRTSTKTAAYTLDPNDNLSVVCLAGGASYTLMIDASTLPSDFSCILWNTDPNDGSAAMRGKYLSVSSGDPSRRFMPGQFLFLKKVGTGVRLSPTPPWQPGTASPELFFAPATATAWTANEVVSSAGYTSGFVRRNGDKLYGLLTDGTCASSGGPTGTGDDITDGTAHWTYLNPACFAWQASTAVAAGAIRSNSGRVYVCTVGGTTAASGGPTGTSASITDNGATWKYVCGAPAATNDGLSLDAPLPDWSEGYSKMIPKEWVLNYEGAPQITLTGLLTSVSPCHISGPMPNMSGHLGMLFRGHPSFPCVMYPPPGLPPFAGFDGGEAVLGDDLTLKSKNAPLVSPSTHFRFRSRRSYGGINPLRFGSALGSGQSYVAVGTHGLFVADNIIEIAGSADYPFNIDPTGEVQITNGLKLLSNITFLHFVRAQGVGKFDGTFDGNGFTPTGAPYNIFNGGSVAGSMALPGGAAPSIDGGWYNYKLSAVPNISSRTKNLADASTTEFINLGFVPSWIEIFGAINGTSNWTRAVLKIDNQGGYVAPIGVATAMTAGSGAMLIYTSTSGSDWQNLQVAAHGPNGLDFNWTKGGAASGVFPYTLVAHS